jgi:kynurenine 3-monooxygenase
MIAGFEDCRLLIERLDSGAKSWSVLFAEFYQNRHADAHAISELALENFIEMRDLVATEEFQLEKRIEKEIVDAGTEGWIPLYTMVTFSDIPYSEARQRGSRQAGWLKKIRLSTDWSCVSDGEFRSTVLEKLESLQLRDSLAEKG